MTLYILYDNQHVSVSPVFGVYDDLEKALDMRMKMAENFADDVLAEDPKESGVTENDRQWIIEECVKSIGLQIKELNESPYA